MEGTIHIVCRYIEFWIDGRKVTKVIKTPYNQIGCCHEAIIDYNDGTTDKIDAVIAIEILFDRPQQAKAVIEDVNTQAEPDPKADIKAKRIEDCNLSVRTTNICKAGGIETLGDLCKLHKTDWLKFRNGGKKSLIELDDLLHDNGLDWAEWR